MTERGREGERFFFLRGWNLPGLERGQQRLYHFRGAYRLQREGEMRSVAQQLKFPLLDAREPLPLKVAAGQPQRVVEKTVEGAIERSQGDLDRFWTRYVRQRPNRFEANSRVLIRHLNREQG